MPVVSMCLFLFQWQTNKNLKNIIKSELINAQKSINTKKIRKGQLDTIFYMTPILLLSQCLGFLKTNLLWTSFEIFFLENGTSQTNFRYRFILYGHSGTTRKKIRKNLGTLQKQACNRQTYKPIYVQFNTVCQGRVCIVTKFR